MKRFIKVAGLIYLGARLERYAGKVLVRYGLVEALPNGSLRKAKDYNERIDALLEQSIFPSRRTPAEGTPYGDPGGSSDRIGGTNHSQQIQKLRGTHDAVDALLADLLEIHDSTGLSLDNWASAKLIIEARTGQPVTPNNA